MAVANIIRCSTVLHQQLHRRSSRSSPSWPRLLRQVSLLKLSLFRLRSLHWQLLLSRCRRRLQLSHSLTRQSLLRPSISSRPFFSS